MPTYKRGDVVVVWLPTTDGAQVKKRPAVVLGHKRYFGADNYLLCLISTKNPPAAPSIELRTQDVLRGSLQQDSFIHPTYLFSTDEQGVEYKAGELRGKVLQQAIDAIGQFLSE